MDICLVAMPFQNIENPSISLSILQACLTRQGLASEVIYANMDFAQRVGLKAYYAIVWSGSYREALLGEYVFAAAAFRSYTSQSGYQDFLRRELNDYIGVAAVAELLQLLEANRVAAKAFIEDMARAILQKRPRVVGCASTTQQNCAALALLRRIKELDPTVITMLGGPNCEGEMGLVLVEEYPWLDFAISGEADEFFAQFCQELLRDGDCSSLPYGVLAKGMSYGSSVPQRVSQRLDDVPMPQYDDYFAALDKCEMKEHVNVGLLIETSRGCWWGEKQPCSFCGLNGAVRKYRYKRAQRVVEEFTALYDKYGVKRFFAVDCILAMPHLKAVMPELAGRTEKLEIMYEVKSNLTYEQLQLLKQAGVGWLQPGIESLEDSFLRLMNKGNRAICHIALLKAMAELKIECCWILLCDLPREQPQWYADLANVMAKITHLPAPDAVFKVRYDRFSHYYYHAADYGLELIPVEAYRYIYPQQWRDRLGELAYFFADRHHKRPLYADAFTQPHHQQIARQARAWKQSYHSARRDRLAAAIVDDYLEIVDLRPGAKQCLYKFSGVLKAVAMACRRVCKARGVTQQLADDFLPADVATAIKILVKDNLLIKINDELLLLATFATKEKKIATAPAGKVFL